MAKIEMDMSEWQTLMTDKSNLAKRVGELEAQIVENQLASVPGLDEAVVAMRNARWAIGFGIGELHYDNVKGWPWKRLLAFVEVFEKLPGLDQDDKNWAEDARSFCEGARQREIERTNRKPDDKPTPIAL